jgi:hypothetical protein
MVTVSSGSNVLLAGFSFHVFAFQKALYLLSPGAFFYLFIFVSLPLFSRVNCHYSINTV